ncbi:DUF3939 domain-containing protein [Ectobacillus ponti]|uniref:DUF3939 domain-containing protein n=1 Tax=Ectobacillus ponti TaxID=2961894 RepID=A0AA42BSW7_9BACI|nr:DUF3939 domain-containing protein [Ectobacillus ponti]MCP8968878.1 DUF3939 domain-containing protein [Ectobacillus ponti]
MFRFFKEGKGKREITQQELEIAIAAFLEQHPNIAYTVLVNEDYTVNFKLLKPYLPAVPLNQFLITRETLEVFPDTPEYRELIQEIDAVQKAVDQYVMDKETFPVVESDEYHRICPMKLLPYLRRQLERELYISEKHYLVSSRPDHKKIG